MTPQPPLHVPLAQRFPIHSRADVDRLEQEPLALALPAQSSYALLRNAALAFGDKTALALLRSGDPAQAPRRWSYTELLQGIHRTANLLHQLGLGPTDVVAVLMPASLETHLALWGGAAACIVQPLNPLLSEDKLAALLDSAQASVLLAWGEEAEAGYWSKALRLRQRVPGLRHLLRVDPGLALGDGGPADAPTDTPALPAGVLDFHAAVRAQPHERLVSGRRITASDIAAYFHTGGTTGAPKLARHSHGAQVFTAWACVQMQGIGPQDVAFNPFPLFHVAGVLPGALTALSAGATTVIPTPTLLRNREVLAHYWQLLARHRATMLSGVPTVLAALADVPTDGADLSALRYCRTGAAALPPELAARFEQVTGLHVHESLGMTETAGISTIRPPGVRAPAGCVGFVVPHARMRVVALDAQGQPTERNLPAGERGLLLYQGPNVFSGFLDPADNAQAFTPSGWLNTGDLGWFDGEGRLHLCGRAKDLIIRSGHNIDPRVIEDALASHPAVHMAAAVAAPDAYAGELPVAFVALRPGCSASEEELLEHVARRVDEAPARPRRVRVLAQLPLTNVGKLYKPALRALATQEVVAALVQATCERLGLAPQHGATVQLEGDRVVLRCNNTGADNSPQAQLHKALHQALATLPQGFAITLEEASPTAPDSH